MDTFPITVRIKVLDDISGNPIPNIVVGIRLFANYKNNYGFVLPISNSNGIIEFNKDWLNQQIDKERNFFIMDFSSRLDDCKPRFEFYTYAGEKIQALIKAQQLYKDSFNIPQVFIDQLSLVDNFKYQPLTQMIELHREKIIEVELKLNRAK
jgi:hypothetical protein